MRTAFIVSALAFIVPALGAPTLIPVVKSDGPVKPDSYIIKFKDDASKGSALSKIAEKLKGKAPGGSSMTYDYAPTYNGIAAKLSPDDLDFVRSMSGIDSIYPDSIMSLVDYIPSEARDVVTPAAEHGSLLGRGDGASDGAGVTVYGIDTGIYVEHKCFGGRAKWGAVFGGYAQQDGNGHGTHTAGTAVGKDYGLATGANIVAVKVLSDQGSGAKL